MAQRFMDAAQRGWHWSSWAGGRLGRQLDVGWALLATNSPTLNPRPLPVALHVAKDGGAMAWAAVIGPEGPAIFRNVWFAGVPFLMKYGPSISYFCMQKWHCFILGIAWLLEGAPLEHVAWLPIVPSQVARRRRRLNICRTKARQLPSCAFVVWPN